MTSNVSKTNAYAVLGNPLGANVSKVNAYAILTTEGAPTVDADPLDLRWKILAGDPVESPALELRWFIGGYITGDFNLAWRLGTTTPEYLALGLSLPAVDPTDLTSTNSRGTWSSSRLDNGTPVQQPEEAGVDGAIIAQPTTPLPAGDCALCRFFTGDYYFRIWVLPPLLQVQNPRADINIPFELWNAYPQENTLNTISAIGATGLSLDISTPADFNEIEIREVNIVIAEDAPIDIHADYTFDFTLGDGLFKFLASMADFISSVPDIPVSETWEWLTDIIEAHNGQEQRIALRISPRRAIDEKFILENDSARRAEFNRWFKGLNNRVIVPYYQYSTRLTASAAIGTSIITFDPTTTDVRAGEFVIALDPGTQGGILLRLETVTTTGATLSSPLQDTLPEGYIIAPAFTSILQDNSGPSMTAVAGEMKIKARSIDARNEFARPGSTVTLTAYDGFNVLDHRPLANESVDDNLRGNYEVFDSETGVLELKSAWPHPYASGDRQFLIQRVFNPAGMDYWRDFLNAANGRQNPFLAPTWREDLNLSVAPTAGQNSMIITNEDYASEYFPYESYKRFQIETGAGIIYRKALQATDNGDGTTTVELDSGFGTSPEELTINKISFLNIVRLGLDKITLRHKHLETVININIRQVDV